MLTIKDLVANKEMTKQSMAAVFGGHRIGNYSYYRNGRWSLYHRRAFRVIVRTSRGLRRGIQYQYSWKRLQTYHKGVLRIYG